MKKFKRIMCVLLTALVLLSIVPISASASEYEPSDMPLLVTQKEITTGVQGERTIDVNVDGTEAKVDDKAIATITKKADSEDWVVTGVAVGETNVYITKGEYTATVKVNVEQPEISPASVTMQVGDLEFCVTHGLGENAVWESSNTKVVIVDEDGIMEAVGKGTAKVKVTQGTLSLVCSVTVKSNVKKIKNITAKTISSKVIELKWGKIKDADGYKIEAKTGNGKFKTVKTIKKPTVTTAKIKGLKAGSVYKFRVKPYTVMNGKEYGTYSNIVSAMTLPAKTSFTKVTVKSAHSVSLEWKPVKGATGYLISKKVKGGEYVFAKDVTAKKAKTTVVKGLKANKNHSFKIQAYKILDKNIAYAKASKAIKAKTPAKTSASMKFYAKFPQVPDLGFIAGAKCVYNTTVTQKGYDYNMYYYDAGAVCLCEGQWYMEMLEEYGFTFTKTPGLGIKGMTGYVKGNTVVLLMADEDYFVVAVVEK